MTCSSALGRSAAVLLCASVLCASRPALAQFSQYGPKIIGNDPVGTAEVGHSVSLSGDGTTALLGGPSDSNAVGAAFAYFRGSSWFQQGAKLIGSGNVRAAQEGFSVSLSADGNTAITGGWNDGLTGALASIAIAATVGTNWAIQGLNAD